MSVEADVAAGMRAQLGRRDAELVAGAAPLGWKLGLTVAAVQERLGLAGPVVGYLTSGGSVEPGSTVSLAGYTTPMLEPEVAIHVGDGGRVTGFGPAIELVDIDLPFEDLEAILAGNVFHRAVVLGPTLDDVALETVTARVLINGTPAAEAPAAEAVGDPQEVADFVSSFLEPHGAALRPGDAIIAGSITPPVPIEPGDDVVVDLGPVGTLALQFAGA